VTSTLLAFSGIEERLTKIAEGGFKRRFGFAIAFFSARFEMVLKPYCPGKMEFLHV
tara:strand:- start:69 stop:236 length:168 start_codon:yes stop_codon:yes gene_type:complete